MFLAELAQHLYKQGACREDFGATSTEPTFAGTSYGPSDRSLSLRSTCKNLCRQNSDLTDLTNFNSYRPIEEKVARDRIELRQCRNTCLASSVAVLVTYQETNPAM